MCLKLKTILLATGVKVTGTEKCHEFDASCHLHDICCLFFFFLSMSVSAFYQAQAKLKMLLASSQPEMLHPQEETNQ